MMAGKTDYFFLVGAPKCGTETLSAMLRLHPDVCVNSEREPNYFTDYAERSWSGPGIEGLLGAIPKSWAEYDSQFAHEPNARWRMDGSTDYLSCPATPGKLAAFSERPDVGRVKVAIILRDPVARAVSQYQHSVRDHLDSGSLGQAIALEEERFAKGMHPLFWHAYRGRYAEQIARYRTYFPDLLILDFHALREGTTVIDTLTDWLEIDRAEANVMPQKNVSHVYRSRLITGMMKNEKVINIARFLVPRGFRQNIRSTIAGMNKQKYTPSPAELDAVRAALSDDIAACVADPAIPTDRWTLALNG